jgi:hypothetical protein
MPEVIKSIAIIRQRQCTMEHTNCTEKTEESKLFCSSKLKGFHLELVPNITI